MPKLDDFMEIVKTGRKGEVTLVIFYPSSLENTRQEYFLCIKEIMRLNGADTMKGVTFQVTPEVSDIIDGIEADTKESIRQEFKTPTSYQEIIDYFSKFK